MLDIESFLKGYKPALLYDTDSDQELQQLNEFPFIYVRIYNKDQHLYFRSEQLKQEFLKRTKDLEPDSPDYHKETGLALGFPPKAVDFFCTNLVDVDKTLDLPRIAIDYCGICCISSIDSLIEDVSYLWENVNVPSSDQTPTKIGYKPMGDYEYIPFFTRFNDYDSLYQARKEIKKALISQGSLPSFSNLHKTAKSCQTSE